MRKTNSFCSTRNRICRLQSIPITNYMRPLYRGMSSPHILCPYHQRHYVRKVFLCKMHRRMCNFAASLRVSRKVIWQNSFAVLFKDQSVKFIEFVSTCAVAFRRRRLQLFRYLELVNVSFQSGPPTSIFCRIIREMLLFL